MSERSVAVDPVQEEAAFRSLRGGCWGNDGQYCRSARRNWSTPTFRRYYLGFRPALEGASA